MRRTCHAILLLVASMLMMHGARARPGDLYRCTGADGRSIFTDTPCDQIGASVKPDMPKDPGASAQPAHVHVHDCARTLEALRDGLHAALEAHDVNKTTAFYHWPGIGPAEVDGVLRRFQTLVARPLVGVEIENPHIARAEHADQPGATETVQTAGGIAIVQTRGFDDPTPVRTQFGLTRNMGCWWVRF